MATRRRGKPRRRAIEAEPEDARETRSIRQPRRHAVAAKPLERTRDAGAP
ncbi:MAG TPA: hypothetical protein PKA82_09925 [Pyrinomonadaceae bacterium]|nr:hypothetical protein [Pyrinomonadaceae bacterium]